MATRPWPAGSAGREVLRSTTKGAASSSWMAEEDQDVAGHDHRMVHGGLDHQQADKRQLAPNRMAHGTKQAGIHAALVSWARTVPTRRRKPITETGRLGDFFRRNKQGSRQMVKGWP